MRIKNIVGQVKYTLELYNHWRKCESYKPFYVELLVSGRCNSRCVMCNIWKLEKKRPELLNDELSTQQIKNLFLELSEMGTERIFISGGEPLLRNDIVDIIKYAKKLKIRVDLVTNGLLLTESMAKELVKSGLDYLCISVDSPTPESHEKIRRVKGGWSRAVKGIGFINEAKKVYHAERPYININYIISRITYQHISKMIDLKSEFGYDTITFLPVVGKVQGVENLFLTEDDIKKLKRSLNEIRNKIEDAGLPKSMIKTLSSLCSDMENSTQGKYAKSINSRILCFAPWKMTTIDPFGNVYPCCFACTFQNLSEDLEHSFWGGGDFCMGNIKNSTFREIWDNERYSRFRKLCKNPPSFPFCDWCGYRTLGDAVLTGLFKDRALLFDIVNQKLRKNND